MEAELRPKVVVTGFGPFGNHKINASWEAVKLLPSLKIEEELGVQLITKEIPVEYDQVQKIVPQLWNEHKPSLMIHVGVSSIASEITLEVEAHRSGYCLLDTQGYVPPTGCCCKEGEDCLQSTLNLPLISLNVTQQDGILACVSRNAGRYLCEYTYYTSLNVDRSRSLFIHVPELGKPYTDQQLAQGIKSVLREILKSLKDNYENNHADS